MLPALSNGVGWGVPHRSADGSSDAWASVQTCAVGNAGARVACVSILGFVPMLAGAPAAPRTGTAVRTPANGPTDGDFEAIFTPVFVSVPVVEAPTSRLRTRSSP